MLFVFFFFILLICRLAVGLFFYNPRVVLSAKFIFAFFCCCCFCCGFTFAVHYTCLLYFILFARRALNFGCRRPGSSQLLLLCLIRRLGWHMGGTDTDTNVSVATQGGVCVARRHDTCIWNFTQMCKFN